LELANLFLGSHFLKEFCIGLD